MQNDLRYSAFYNLPARYEPLVFLPYLIHNACRELEYPVPQVRVPDDITIAVHQWYRRRKCSYAIVVTQREHEIANGKSDSGTNTDIDFLRP